MRRNGPEVIDKISLASQKPLCTRTDSKVESWGTTPPTLILSLCWSGNFRTLVPANQLIVVRDQHSQGTQSRDEHVKSTRKWDQGAFEA